MPGSSPPSDPSPSIEAHLEAGRTLQAIKMYREGHRVGLEEAKDAIEAIRQKRLAQ